MIPNPAGAPRTSLIYFVTKMKSYGTALPFYLILLLFFVLPACTSSSLDDLIATPTPSPTPTIQPTATADLTSTFIGHMSLAQGIALQYPDNWTLRDEPTLMLASDPALLQESAGATSGAIITLLPTPSELSDATELAATLNQLITQDGVQIIQESGAIMLNGQEAAQLTAVSLDNLGLEFRTYYIAIRNGSRTTLFAATTPDDDTHETVLQAIINSIIVDEMQATPTPPPPTLAPLPTAVPPSDVLTDTTTLTGTQVTTSTAELSPILTADIPPGFVQYTSTEDWYTLGYPPDWFIDDRNPQAVLLASSENLLNDNPFAEGGGTVFVYTGEVSLPSEPSAVTLLESFISSYAIYDDFDLAIAPYPLQIGAYNGASARYDVVFQRATVTADYYTIVKGNRFIIFVALINIDSIPTLRPLTQALVATTTIK